MSEPVRKLEISDKSSFAQTTAAPEAQATQEQIERIQRAVRTWPKWDRRAPQEKKPASEPAPRPAAQKNFKWRIVVRSLIALALIGVLAAKPIQKLMASTSVEAVVNAHLITIRAPIDGEVDFGERGVEIGQLFQTGEDILKVENSRSDTARVNDLQRAADQLASTLGGLEKKKGVLAERLKNLQGQQERFRSARIRQVEKRVAEIGAQVAGAEEDHKAAGAALVRAIELERTKVITLVNFEKAKQTDRVTAEAVNALNQRRAGAQVELEALKAGDFVGDSYNDTPQSAQRAVEVELDLADLDARIEGTHVELRHVEDDLTRERLRAEKLSSAPIRAATRGRVWEVLTSPGEHVSAGQDLMRVINCDDALVIASVSENTYEGLRIGQRAVFQPRDGSPPMSGSIAVLNGLGAVAANGAVPQSALSREPYHVTVKFPDIAKTGDCRISQAGLVTFQGAEGSVAADVKAWVLR